MNLSGERVRLRPIQLSDAELLCKWKNDEALYMYLGGGYHPISLDQYRKWVENMIDQTGANRRFIVETIQCKPIGMFGLYDIHWVHRTCQVGAFLAEPSTRNQGLGCEAYRLLEGYARNYLNLRKITLNVVDNNEIGKRFWQKNGFQPVGRLCQERYINGKYCDVLVMERFIQFQRETGDVE